MLSTAESFAVVSTVRSYPKADYAQIKNDVLGRSYTLTLVFVGAARAQSYNQAHRNKSYIPNVLSFPLTEKTGEIIICPEVARKEAKNHGLSYEGYITYLFIHGLLHLKGHDHGAKMDALEARYRKKYAVT